ncbi:ABC transporter ATP-binding protein [Hyphococcus flavus]|uniref:ABC transporter ATP-binding protein n=1 Tax=Hyphococcus flavus TaxID=1866326 RepID=A0AAE9ZD33_9PROT|nr:ABC transporter ATP-binding protein [Hyphococcus flavus]WDI32311.1 ABC transporter ATP-binding protein [Hyphococcus flavus]
MTFVLTNISHQFGQTRALASASLSVEPGELVCLFGPSGCGKTTLLKIAAGLEPLQQGSVELDGSLLARPGQETPPEKRPVGLVFQDYVLFPHMTVEKNVAFGLKGQPKPMQRAADYLKSLGIGGLARRYPHELSGGQQQRVALARALARQPMALLLDEPFASIDVTLRRRLREDLRRTLKEQNAAVVMVTHDPEEALAIGDRIAMMRKGEIIEIASPENLFFNPQTLEGASIFPGSQHLPGVIANGVFRSALGETETALGEGPAHAVLRPDALRARQSETGLFEIGDVRFAGPHWLARLKKDGADMFLTVSFDACPPSGGRAEVQIDWSQTPIFSM